jgi:hypothetical protein
MSARRCASQRSEVDGDARYLARLDRGPDPRGGSVPDRIGELRWPTCCSVEWGGERTIWPGRSPVGPRQLRTGLDLVGGIRETHLPADRAPTPPVR